MCRRNQLLGILAAGVGIGLLLASFFESAFFCCCFGCALVVVGVAILQKK